MDEKLKNIEKTAETQNKENAAKITELEKTNKELTTKNTELQKKVDEAAPWFEKEEEERKAEAEKAQKEKEEKEKKEKEAKEAEEKKGYDTGITYDNLARTPDDYIGKKIKFSGKVIQVIEGTSDTKIRLAVGGCEQ